LYWSVMYGKEVVGRGVLRATDMIDVPTQLRI
jgi:hypothetical protein